MKFILLLLFTCLSCLITKATNTNSLYNAGDVTVELAPSVSLYSSGYRTYGYSFENTYWEYANTGTSLELGLYNINNFYSVGPIDHSTIYQDFRIIPFPNTKFLDRTSLGLDIGTETSFINGQKAIDLRPNIVIELNKRTRIQASLTQHVQQNPFTTVVVGFQWTY